MDAETRAKADALMDAIESDPDVNVTSFDLNEYHRGDPTTGDSVVMGAEITLTAYLSLNDPDDDENPYRLK